MHKKQTGFTIVELLIVIVVIGILAAITIVAYTGVQKRARDAQRTSDLTTLVKSMTLWSIQTSKRPIETGAGYNGNGTGWVYNASTFPGYTTDIEKVLSDAGLLSSGTRDPQTPTGDGSYMFYPCAYTGAKSSTYAFFARLESSPSVAGNDIAQWSTLGCVSNPLDARYGMNYAKIFTSE